MQVLSYTFVLLWVITFALYYLVPQKRKWQILLVAGGVFFFVGGEGGGGGARLFSFSAH